MFSFSLGKYPGVELLNCMVVLFLILWRNSILFSMVPALIYIPTNTIPGLPFLQILTNTCYFLSFWWQSPWQLWGDTPLWFCFAFPWWLVMWSIFSYVCWSSVCFLWKNTRIKVLCSYFNHIVYFLYWVIWVLYMFWILTFYLKYCLPSISSHSIICSSVCDALLCFVEVLYCEWVPFIYFYFCFICLRRQIQKIFLIYVKDHLSMFSSRGFYVFQSYI